MPFRPLAALRRWRYRTAPKAVILRYHRIVDLATDPYDFAVSPARFAEHCALLRSRYAPVPLADVVAGIANRRLPERGVAVTFDDGYRDVLDEARPILERYQVPATVYLVSGMVGGGVFWWDLLERILLWPGDLPDRLEVTGGREPMVFSLGASASYDAETFDRHRRWTWRSPDDPTERHRIFRHLHARLVRLDDPERRAAVDQLVQWAGIDPSALADRAVLGANDIAARRDDPILDVGAHTVTHPSLARLGDVRQRSEVTESKRTLEGWLGRPVTTMAFPYGRAGATSIVREAGFTAACTTREMAVLPDDDPYRLPRLRVGDWSGAELARRLEEQGL